tara:strand:+ start:664 stop:942 length:279 start_codon:yes stop_codon:yes gene_type:complete
LTWVLLLLLVAVKQILQRIHVLTGEVLSLRGLYNTKETKAQATEVLSIARQFCITLAGFGCVGEQMDNTNPLSTRPNRLDTITNDLQLFQMA